MEIIFTFLIKSSIGIMLFYMVYWLFLRKETFYTANRWFLVLALVSAVLLPLFPIQFTVITEPQNNSAVFHTIADTFKNIPVFSEGEFESKSFNWQQTIWLIYLTGAAIFFMRLLTQTFVLVHLMIKYRISSLDGVRIVENEKYGLPFSFFNIVFINPKFHKQDDLPEILAHEKVHIREKHWFDLLFIELLTVIFWFNPFIWFFERSIKQNHEYLADKGVLSEGHGVARYQALLVNQLMGMQIIGITNNLNFALNTNRLKMMTKKKTSRIHWVKFVWTLPVLAILLFAFAEPSFRVNDPDLSSDSMIRESIGNSKVKMVGYVLDEKGNPLPGTSIYIKGTHIGTVADIKGQFKLEVPEKASITLTFVGKKTLMDSYAGITSGSNKEGVFYKKYKMKDAVIVIGRDVPPPPPPKMNTKNEMQVPPPPPPPSKPSSKGEREVFYVVEDLPQYAGGPKSLQEYITKMQKKIAIQKKVKGKAKVAFTVNAKGKVTDIKVVEKDNEDAAKGAYLIAKEMKDWTPGKQRGKGVPVKYLLPVEFN